MKAKKKASRKNKLPKGFTIDPVIKKFPPPDHIWESAFYSVAMDTGYSTQIIPDDEMPGNKERKIKTSKKSARRR